MRALRLGNMIRNRWQVAPSEAQLEYYRRTASTYDCCHVSGDDEHAESLQYVAALVAQMNATSLLDAGCGTGRGVRYFREKFPTLEVYGNDPSPDLLRIASESHGLATEKLHCCGTLDLPFPERYFDVVTSFAVLHHVPNPSDIVKHLIRLSRKAVFISDSNYMGQGRLVARLVKLGLTQVGLWPFCKFVQQGFRGWQYSEGDGISYSYSVFNDLSLIQRHFAKVIVIPVGFSDAKYAVLSPKVRAPTVLVCGLDKLADPMG